MDTDLVSDVGNSDVIAASTDKEIQAFRNFRRFYEEIFPYPTAVRVRMQEVLGWKIWAALIQSAFSIALAAMRTANMFYRVAVSSSPILATAEAVAAVGAVEGGVVIFAAIRSEMQNRVDDEGVKIHAAVWQLWLGELLGIAISVVAGLGLTFIGLGNVARFSLSWWLGVILGAGASLIAAISGEIIGSTLSSLSNASAAASRAFKLEVSNWKENMFNKWKVSAELKIARGELKAAANSVNNSPRRHSGPSRGGNGNNVIRGNIFTFLDAYVAQNPEATTLPGPSQVSRELDVAKSYASQVIHEWMDARGYNDQQAYATPIEEEVDAIA